MLVMKERQPPFRTAERWARLVLLEVGAIRECEEHGWMRDRSDPHARERDALFVSVDLQKQCPFAAFADRRHKAIFAAVAFFHANDLGAKFGQQCRAIRPRDIAPEIQDAHALQNSPHRSFPLCFRQIRGNGFRGKVATDTKPLPAEVIAQWFKSAPV